MNAGHSGCRFLMRAVLCRWIHFLFLHWLLLIGSGIALVSTSKGHILRLVVKKRESRRDSADCSRARSATFQLRSSLIASGAVVLASRRWGAVLMSMAWTGGGDVLFVKQFFSIGLLRCNNVVVTFPSLFDAADLGGGVVNAVEEG